MEKEFIPYEQALALKELGFDEACFTYYGNISQALFGLKGNIEFRTNTLLDNSHGKNIVSSAPTFSQAFRWFREKYGLEIALSPDSFNNISKNLRQYKIISYDKSWKLEEILEPSHWIRKGCFVSYEEAELECLKKLIEIVKNK